MIAAIILFAAFGATAETTNDLSDAEIQGRNLAQKILQQHPPESSTNSGILNIKDAKGVRSEVPIQCKTIVTTTNWQTIYKASWTNHYEILRVIHAADQSDSYFYDTNDPVPILGDIPVLGHLFKSPQKLSDTEIMTPFANSDFWIADLGLEFFHWPEQKILKKETRKTRSCNVLESTNPNPSTNGYSRVVSWIDEEGGFPIHAEAYDAQNKLLKVFDPKSFKKVNGQWQPELMEMENVQTSSRTWIDFNPGPLRSPKG
ncbi:MAG TPA: outer membrane lipoprotein-sorting protein [Verrucomicrobiae bacterium]|nr:outer membrane lipoprotein-sorting protein [Verrucomicrobiae bacterium]